MKKVIKVHNSNKFLVTITIDNNNYYLPPKSTSSLPDTGKPIRLPQGVFIVNESV